MMCLMKLFRKTRIIAIKAVKETIDSMQRGILRNGGRQQPVYFCGGKADREVLENQDVIYNLSISATPIIILSTIRLMFAFFPF